MRAGAKSAGEIRIHRDGLVECFSGAQDIGSGLHRHGGGDRRGARPPAEGHHHARGRRAGPSAHSGGSNTTNSVAPVVRMAANDAKKKLFAAAAPSRPNPRGSEAHGGGKVLSRRNRQEPDLLPGDREDRGRTR